MGLFSATRTNKKRSAAVGRVDGYREAKSEADTTQKEPDPEKPLCTAPGSVGPRLEVRAVDQLKGQDVTVKSGQLKGQVVDPASSVASTALVGIAQAVGVDSAGSAVANVPEQPPGMRGALQDDKPENHAEGPWQVPT